MDSRSSSKLETQLSTHNSTVNGQRSTANFKRLIVIALILALAATGEAQRRGGGRGGGRGGFGVRPAVPEDFDGSWQFCRVWFRQNPNGDGGGWSVDYPRADINVSIRLSELTKTTVGFAGPEDPKHVIIRLTDPTLYQCPFIMMTEVGAAYIGDDEAEALRSYLLKGGFLWADDFWGEYAWEAWAEQIAKVLPPAQYPPKDLPKDHPLFRSVFEIGTGVPQIASIGYWLGSGGGTSERPDSTEPHARAIVDQQGRIMVLMTHNTDIGDSWEEEASNPQYFYEFSTKGYAFGVDAIVYGLTH
jgi:Domain of unknown function (DUF4159)